MKIYTESGSIYEIDERGICKKYNSDGVAVDAFKVYVMKALDDDVLNFAEIWEAPESMPEIGKRLYISGKDGWWLSTPVVRIEY